MNWIEDINTEFNNKSEVSSIVDENFESVFDEFYEIAESEVQKVNDELYQEDRHNRISCHVYTDYQNNNQNEFYVQADLAVENKKVCMTVSFSKNDEIKKGSTENNFIRVERKIDGESLPETLAVRFDTNVKKITYEPVILENQTIDDELLARLLVEPVIRKFLRLPQKFYSGM